MFSDKLWFISTGPSLQKLKENVLDMLCGIPEGVNIAKFVSTYKRHYGQQLVLAKYGLVGFQDLITALGDEVCVERIGDRNVIKIATGVHHLQNPSSCQGRTGHAPHAHSHSGTII